ncbi:reverse transcriptase domain-containing protein [Tanacetum coccineum]
MIREIQFDGRIRSDPHRHIADFLEISNLFQYGENQEESVMLRTFPFSLSGEAKTWLNELDEGTITTWNEMREAFVSRYFSPAKFKRLLNKIRNFHQLDQETFVDAWLRMKEMVCTCYEHGGIFLYNTPKEALKILEDKKFKALATKIDSEFLKIRKELKEMRDGRRDNYASQIYMSDDTPMCDPIEANYVHGYHGGYHDQKPRNLYSYPNHNPNYNYPHYFNIPEPSTEEMMREWIDSQMKANEVMKN